MPQMIVGSFFDPATMFKAKKAMGVTKKVDNVSQGYRPTGNTPDGVLLELKSVPVAFYDYPTLNKMVFRRSLWSGLLADPELTTRMREARAFWGESGHQDNLEIKIPLISNKVTDFWCSDDKNNLVLGDVQVLDTPEGNIAYSLLKSGDLGISSRGWGDLNPINSGIYPEFSSADFFSIPDMRVVKEEGYIASCWDFVTVPAVGAAMMSIRQHLDRFRGAKESVKQAFERYPVKADYTHLKQMLSEQVREKKVFVIGSGVRPRVNVTPLNDDNYEDESNKDNGEAFEFKRGTSGPGKDRKTGLEMGKNGFEPVTVEDMRTRRYRDIVLPHLPMDETIEKKPQKQASKLGDAILQARKKGSDGMSLNKLSEEEQRTMFDRMVSVELARALELRSNLAQADF